MVEVGQKFHMVTAVSFAGKSKSGHRSWNCLCDCGREWVAREQQLKITTRSCGCDRMNHLTFRSHGKHKSSEYRIWAGMIQRCTNPAGDEFENYGGRGIKVCDRWLDFVNFFSVLGPRPSRKHSIDRIKNDGGYEPGNVRWATQKEQMRNTRRNRMVDVMGSRMVMKDAASMFGVRSAAIYYYARYHKVSHQEAVDFYVKKYLPQVAA